ncbi:MAG TPA: purine-nucleoside phosphorylase [Candidatus Latescibacteria bacterium]|nr:purine-nucleoside phosphorylase [Candidatus Latescibacterota bacterium]
MSELIDKVKEAVEAIRSRTEAKPKVGIILGTGLGGLVSEIEERAEISYGEIPHFPLPTVMTHAGKLIFGKLGGKRVVAMQGRFHRYEGYSMEQITFPVRVMKYLGVRTLVVSNTSGGMNPQFRPGEIMIIADHINLLGDSPLIGIDESDFGSRFVDMSQAYDRKLIDLAERIALDEKIRVRKGVYVAVVGPNLETAAEYRFLRTIGADVVGMSTVPEVIAGVHSGMRILGLSVITDSCLPDALKPVSIEEIFRIAQVAGPELTRLVKRVVEEL